MCECRRRSKEEGAGREREGALAHSLLHTRQALPLPPTLQRGEDVGEGLPAQTGKDRPTDKQLVGQKGQKEGEEQVRAGDRVRL